MRVRYPAAQNSLLFEMGPLKRGGREGRALADMIAALVFEPVVEGSLSGPLPVAREDATTESPFVSLLALGEG